MEEGEGDERKEEERVERRHGDVQRGGEPHTNTHRKKKWRRKKLSLGPIQKKRTGNKCMYEACTRVYFMRKIIIITRKVVAFFSD